MIAQAGPTVSYSVSFFALLILAGLVLGGLALVGMLLANKQTRPLGSILVAIGFLVLGVSVAFWAEKTEREARHLRARSDAARNRDRATASETFDKLTEPRIQLDDGADAPLPNDIEVVQDPPDWGVRPESDYQSGSQFNKELAKQYDADFIIVYATPMRSVRSGLELEERRVLRAARRYLRARTQSDLADAGAKLGMSTEEIYDRFVIERQLVKSGEKYPVLYTLIAINNDDGGDELVAETRELASDDDRFKKQDQQDDPRVASSDPLGTLYVSPDEMPPEWVTKLQHPEDVPGAVFVDTLKSGPYSSPAECVQDQREQLGNTARRFLTDAQPAGSPENFVPSESVLGMNTQELYEKFVKDRYLTESDSSILPMYTLHTLVVIDKTGGEELVQQTIAANHSRKLEKIGLLSGGVLGLLALTFGLLKLDESTRGYYTKRLLIGVPAAIIGVIALLSLA